jgi:hypothetical protein
MDINRSVTVVDVPKRRYNTARKRSVELIRCCFLKIKNPNDVFITVRRRHSGFPDKFLQSDPIIIPSIIFSSLHLGYIFFGINEVYTEKNHISGNTIYSAQFCLVSS